MEKTSPDQAIYTAQECNDAPSNNTVLENKRKAHSQNQDGDDSPTEKNSSSVADDKEEPPKPGRKRSSSLSNLLQLKQFLDVADSGQCERIKLRRVSSIPLTNWGTQETQLEDGLLTTTLCSTEL